MVTYINKAKTLITKGDHLLVFETDMDEYAKVYSVRVSKVSKYGNNKHIFINERDARRLPVEGIQFSDTCLGVVNSEFNALHDVRFFYNHHGDICKFILSTSPVRLIRFIIDEIKSVSLRIQTFSDHNARQLYINDMINFNNYLHAYIKVISDLSPVLRTEGEIREMMELIRVRNAVSAILIKQSLGYEKG